MSAAPTPGEWRAKLAETQAKASRAAKREVVGDLDEAFDLYVASAQSYLYLIRHAPDLNVRGQLKAISAKLVERAERIKLAKKDVKAPKTDRLSLEEQDLVLSRSSHINHQLFERARDPPAQDSTSFPYPQLSARQNERLAAWKRPDASKTVVFRPDMLPNELVQDVVMDCSLVAGLVSAAQHALSFGSRLHVSCLFPQDASGRPIITADGRHRVRMLLNGAGRDIYIDNALPHGGDGSLLCARTRRGDVLWPALIEKAYLTVMGGYDFAGSNSSVDLHALTGWIPEAVEMKSTTFQIERTWDRVLAGFSQGKCLITAGTGPRDEVVEAAGLIPLHDYAIIGVQEHQDGRRTVDLYNAWHRAPGVSERRHGFTGDLREALEEVDEHRPGVFRVSYQMLRNYFDTLYLNWDPAIFEHSQSVHASTSPSPAFSLRFGPAPLADCEREVWVLLSRHFVDRETDSDMYFALDVISDLGGTGSAADAGVSQAAPARFSNSMHILTKFVPMRPQASYLLSIAHRGARSASMPPPWGHCFTLSVHSACPFTLRDAGPSNLPYVRRIEGQWTTRTAGGHHGLSTFGDNPMWRVTVGGGGDGAKGVEVRAKLVALKRVIATENSGEGKGEGVDEEEMDIEKAVNVKILVAGGDGRVFDVEERDVIADSGKYTHGVVKLRCQDLLPGRYTIVPSTFSSGYQASGPFVLTIEASRDLEKVESIPSEGAGMFRRVAEADWTECARGWAVMGAKGGSLSLKARAQALPTIEGDGGLLPPVKLSVLRCRDLAGGEEMREVASSGRFTDARSGCLAGPVHVRYDGDAYYILKPEAHGISVRGRCKLLMYADQAVQLQLLS